MQPNILLKRYDTFFRGITSADRVAVLHDKDPDGISAGVIVSRQVKRLRGRGIDMRIHAPGSAYSLTQSLVKRMHRKKITVLIIVDISADHEPILVKAVSRFARIIIIDHHKLYHTFTEKNIVMLKPQLLGYTINPSKYAASKFAYDLGSRLVDLSDCDWLAATGSIADIATDPWKPWLARVFKRYHVASKKELFETAIGKVAVTINNALVYDPRNVPKVFAAVFAAKKPSDVIHSRLSRYHDAVEKEVEKWIGLMDQRADRHPELNLIVYYVEPKYRIKSTLSTILSFKHPNTTLVLLGPEHNMISVSARRQDGKIPMNDLLERAVKGLRGASAGGHVPAAGGRFRQSDLLRFRSRLLDCMRQLHKSS